MTKEDQIILSAQQDYAHKERIAQALEKIADLLEWIVNRAKEQDEKES